MNLDARQKEQTLQHPQILQPIDMNKVLNITFWSNKDDH